MKAEATGIYGSTDLNKEVIEKILFQNGFSTAKRPDQYAGRGVGINAVRHYLQEIDSTIEIDLDPSGADRDGFCPFSYKITIPQQYLRARKS